MSSLKVALLGLDSFTLCGLEELAQMEQFEIVGIAEQNSELAQKTAGQYNCPAFDDYRQLIIQSQADCLLTASGITKGPEYLRAALKEGYHVLKQPPGGLSYEEASELAQLAQQGSGTLTTAVTARFRQSYIDLHELLDELKDEVFLVRLFRCAAQDEVQQWHSDPKLAGGGVLMHNCYELIDLLVWNFGLAQQVYSLASSLAGDRQQRLYRTEDVACAKLKYSDTMFADVTAIRNIGPTSERVEVYCREKVITAGVDFLRITDAQGKVLRQSKYNQSPQQLMRRLLESFADSVMQVPDHSPAGTSKENLLNMALIESIYLSAKTAMPEEPARIRSLS